MAHKLVKDIDEETWRKFIAYCKLKNATAGEELNNILDDFLKNKFSKLLKKK